MIPKRYPGPERRRYQRYERFAYIFVVIVATIAFAALLISQINSNNRINRQQDALCDVTSAFIQSNVLLRNAQNATQEKSIQLRAQQAATLRAVRTAIVHATTRSELLIAVLAYAQNQEDLNKKLNRETRESVNAADKATAKWSRMRRRLNCR